MGFHSMCELDCNKSFSFFFLFEKFFFFAFSCNKIYNQEREKKLSKKRKNFMLNVMENYHNEMEMMLLAIFSE